MFWGLLDVQHISKELYKLMKLVMCISTAVRYGTERRKVTCSGNGAVTGTPANPPPGKHKDLPGALNGVLKTAEEGRETCNGQGDEAGQEDVPEDEEGKQDQQPGTSLAERLLIALFPVPDN